MDVGRIVGALLAALLLTGCGALPAWTADRLDTATATDTVAVMALTFDDGPNARYTPRLLDGLAERGVKATFFLIGAQAEADPALVERIAAEGHQIGSHTYSHADLRALSPEKGLQEIRRGEAALTAILGPGDYWLRPPYGFVTDEQRAALTTPVIYWSVDTEDWACTDADVILDRVYRGAFDGCIVLLHDSSAASVDAALRCIDHLSARGWAFVTVEELFRLRSLTPEPGGVYTRVRPESQRG